MNTTLEQHLLNVLSNQDHSETRPFGSTLKGMKFESQVFIKRGNGRIVNSRRVTQTVEHMNTALEPFFWSNAVAKKSAILGAVIDLNDANNFDPPANAKAKINGRTLVFKLHKDGAQKFSDEFVLEATMDGSLEVPPTQTGIFAVTWEVTETKYPISISSTADAQWYYQGHRGGGPRWRQLSEVAKDSERIIGRNGTLTIEAVKGIVSTSTDLR